jgi:hypothetical protein
LTNENDAANRFIAQLQANSGDTPDPSDTQPQQIVINRPVRCVFYLAAAPVPVSTGIRPRRQRQGPQT